MNDMISSAHHPAWISKESDEVLEGVMEVRREQVVLVTALCKGGLGQHGRSTPLNGEGLKKMNEETISTSTTTATKK